MKFFKVIERLSVFLLASPVYSCAPTGDPNSPIVPGTDGPAPAATLGYAINHFGLTTTNLKAMKHFYGDILGMRLLFDAHVTPEYTVTYLGYAQGGRNGTGFQTGAELARDKNNLSGLLELVQFNVSEDHLVASTRRSNTFSHIGLIVPDIAKTQEYLEGHGVKILKRYQAPVAQFTGPLQNAFGIGEFAGAHIAAKKALIKAQSLIGLEMLLMVEDPDGNMVEIQQQDPPSKSVL
ncbi:Glyoxalase/Bleomycin resistance protein/Dihydroxybiphenyl dioxygenase [Penicillium argentinense]|uniref:Glyoxalase/Bleomycin resistance protein/Dihydroxybiphenyl dioxygenase n=1 Tax=Penicillium argentinense TaxID=1131581 RepID=A0A9W9EYT7_9EURO|nr:Glyoxalase/Bleomycin resistance protein/Dihydroxybiphenyl dioxygenase [Penicillium argentinense]KAJ5090366.1 Glyoxalase/Bleomycin resistance protein/Dihydroxybiphenyl dioxygenase [Penicillium argentinense]